MGTLKIPLQSICSEEGPHYPLGAKRKEAVIRQATINPIHKFGYPLAIPYSSFKLYYVAWLTEESVSLRIFVKKKGMNPVQSNGRSQQTTSAKGRKGKIQW
jgi:hypothetical protein